MAQFRPIHLSLIVSILLISGCADQTQPNKVASEEAGPAVNSLSPLGLNNGDQEIDVTAISDVSDLTEPGSFVRKTAEATIIDTRDFENPLAIEQPFRGEIISTEEGTEGESVPPLQQGIANGLKMESFLTEPSMRPLANFPGIVQTELTPPDPSLAVGPEQIVEVVNSAIAFFEKDGTCTFMQRLNSIPGEPGFFDEVGGGDFVFDPKVMYDHTIDRFFVVALDGANEPSFLNIAVSDDSDPNGIWFRYRLASTVQVGDTFFWLDYPGLGYDEDFFYVTGNLFRFAGPGPFFGNVLFRSFEKAPLLVGEPAVFTDIRHPTGASVQVAQHFGDNAAPYFIGSGTFSALELIALDDPLGTPSIVSEFIPIPSFTGPGGVPNGAGVSSVLSAVDTRFFNVNWRDGSLWTCHNVEGSSGAVARWYEIDTDNWPVSGTPNLVQFGEINPGDGVSTFFPAIYTDDFGNTAVVIAHSSPTEFASIAVSSRNESDPLGTMGEPVILETGEFAASGRWGDYFDIALDPTDNRTFWTVGETTSFAAGGWSTSINSSTFLLRGDVNNDGAVNLFDVSPFVDVLTNGEFDAAADVNGDGVVNLFDISAFVELITSG